MSVHVRLLLAQTGDERTDGETAWEGWLPEVPTDDDVIGLGTADDGGGGPWVRVLPRPVGWQLRPPPEGGMSPGADDTVVVLIFVMPVGERPEFERANP